MQPEIMWNYITEHERDLIQELASSVIQLS